MNENLNNQESLHHNSQITNNYNSQPAQSAQSAQSA